MKCEKYLNLVDDLVEGELDEQAAEQVNLHLFACAECASYYKTLKQEKEIYAHFLFDVEPSADLLLKFQTKLKSESKKTVAVPEKPSGVFGWKYAKFNFRHLSPAWAGAIVLVGLAFGFGFLNFLSGEKIKDTEFTAKIESDEIQLETAKSNGFTETEIKNLTKQTKTANDNSSPNIFKDSSGNKITQTKKNAVAVKFVAVKSSEIKKKIISADEKEDSAGKVRLTEQERGQLLELKNLETETARQIEKIELLLRSFRNARSIDNGKLFDVAYEKQQARKLLGKNVRLRQNAENYGTFYTGELLARVEPFLLDIANLENDTSGEKVLEIKDRVKNQNIIASLQTYK